MIDGKSRTPINEDIMVWIDAPAIVGGDLYQLLFDQKLTYEIWPLRRVIARPSRNAIQNCEIERTFLDALEQPRGCINFSSYCNLSILSASIRANRLGAEPQAEFATHAHAAFTLWRESYMPARALPYLNHCCSVAKEAFTGRGQSSTGLITNKERAI